MKQEPKFFNQESFSINTSNMDIVVNTNDPHELKNLNNENKELKVSKYELILTLCFFKCAQIILPIKIG